MKTYVCVNESVEAYQYSPDLKPEDMPGVRHCDGSCQCRDRHGHLKEDTECYPAYVDGYSRKGGFVFPGYFVIKTTGAHGSKYEVLNPMIFEAVYKLKTEI